MSKKNKTTNLLEQLAREFLDSARGQEKYHYVGVPKLLGAWKLSRRTDHYSCFSEDGWNHVADSEFAEQYGQDQQRLMQQAADDFDDFMINMVKE